MLKNYESSSTEGILRLYIIFDSLSQMEKRNVLKNQINSMYPQALKFDIFRKFDLIIIFGWKSI